MARTDPFWKRLIRIFQHEIWQSQYLGEKSLRGRFYAVLRVISITLTGLEETKAVSRAAALSFSSLLGLGPLVALAVLVAGFVLDKNDPKLAVNTLNRIVTYIAPPIAEYDKNEAEQANKSDIVTAATMGRPAPKSPARPPANPAPAADATAAPESADSAGAGAAAIQPNPSLVVMFNGFIDQSRNGAVGPIAAITFIFVVLQLFTSVENAFNEIWGVRRGRGIFTRIFYYWTVITLVPVLFFAAVTGLSAGASLTFADQLADKLPFGREIINVLKFFLPSLAGLFLIGVLTVFYRTIPNTRVFWRAAFAGAVVVAALIILNNFLSFLYLSRVVQQKSLWGSLGVLPILMFGLYIFWLFVLLGGQISYAVQNVHFRNSQAAWNSLAESMRERLSLIVLLTIGRRFQECLPPCSTTQLSEMLKVPTQILNECISRLVSMNLVAPIPPTADTGSTDFKYQPARPLSRITLAQFKSLDDDLGGDPSGPALADLDPVVRLYNESLARLTDSEFFQTPLDKLIEEHRDNTSRPPFAFGQNRS